MIRHGLVSRSVGVASSIVIGWGRRRRLVGGEGGCGAAQEHDADNHDRESDHAEGHSQRRRGGQFAVEPHAEDDADKGVDDHDQRLGDAEGPVVQGGPG